MKIKEAIPIDRGERGRTGKGIKNMKAKLALLWEKKKRTSLRRMKIA